MEAVDTTVAGMGCRDGSVGMGSGMGRGRGSYMHRALVWELCPDGYCLWSGMGIVTPSVLHPKSFIKTCHEHHVYVLMYVIECVDKFFVT